MNATQKWLAALNLMCFALMCVFIVDNLQKNNTVGAVIEMIVAGFNLFAAAIQFRW